MAEYANTTTHAQQVGSGAFIPAYGQGAANPDAPKTAPKDDASDADKAAYEAATAAAAHDAALIEAGILVAAEKPKQSRSSGEEN